MPIVNVTLPSDGTGADVGDYNPAILAILAVLNGHIASDNIEPGSLDWSVMSGTMTNVIPSTAMQDSGSAEKFRAESKIGFSASGLVWSALTGLNATMTAGIQYTPDGLRRSISAVTSRAFTASKDTYVSISPAGAIAYTEVANNAAQPALGTDYRWLAKVVTSASDITSVTDMRQTAVIGSQNIDWAASIWYGVLATGTYQFTGLADAQQLITTIPTDRFKNGNGKYRIDLSLEITWGGLASPPSVRIVLSNMINPVPAWVASKANRWADTIVLTYIIDFTGTAISVYGVRSDTSSGPSLSLGSCPMIIAKIG